MQDEAFRQAVAGGVLIALDRDAAKAFFGCRDDVSRRAFVLERLGEPTQASTRLGNCWQSLQRCLADGTLVPGAGTPPLSWCLLGGRPMAESAAGRIFLLRPDMVQQVNAALGDIDMEWYRGRAEEVAAASDVELCTPEAMHEPLAALKACYAAAAAGQCAILFAVDH